MIGRLWRYLFIQTLIGLIGAAVIITAVILLIDFVETSRDIGTRCGNVLRTIRRHGSATFRNATTSIG